MRQNPLHAPNHENMDWRAFVTSPWIMNRSQSDLIFETKGKLCQWGFNYSEVIPCLLSSKFQKDPVYELKREFLSYSYFFTMFFSFKHQCKVMDLANLSKIYYVSVLQKFVILLLQKITRMFTVS